MTGIYSHLGWYQIKRKASGSGRLQLGKGGYAQSRGMMGAWWWGCMSYRSSRTTPLWDKKINKKSSSPRQPSEACKRERGRRQKKKNDEQCVDDKTALSHEPDGMIIKSRDESSCKKHPRSISQTEGCFPTYLQRSCCRRRAKKKKKKKLHQTQSSG